MKSSKERSFKTIQIKREKKKVSILIGILKYTTFENHGILDLNKHIEF
jgi:hypothetical protein